MGKRLNVVPSSLNYVYINQPTNWAIDEYIIQSVKIFKQTQLKIDTTSIDSSTAGTKVRLATPKYMKMLASGKSQNNTEIETETTNIQNPKLYYALIYTNYGEIVNDINDAYGNSTQLKYTFGPLNSYEQIINILNQYADINNAKIELITDMLFNIL